MKGRAGEDNSDRRTWHRHSHGRHQHVMRVSLLAISALAISPLTKAQPPGTACSQLLQEKGLDCSACLQDLPQPNVDCPARSAADDQKDEVAAIFRGKPPRKLYNETEFLFNGDHVRQVEFHVSPANWKVLVDAPAKEEYVDANITIDGTTINDVGLRFKGFVRFVSTCV